MFHVWMLPYKCCHIPFALFYRKSILKFCSSGAAASIIDPIRLEHQFYKIIFAHGIWKCRLKMVGYFPYLNRKSWKERLS